MKTVESPSLFGGDSETISARNSIWLDAGRSLTDVFYTDYSVRAYQITPLRVFLVLIIFLIIAGLWYRAAMISALSLTSTLALLYFFAHHQAESIEVSRVAPGSATEEDTLTIEYVIRSRSKWGIRPAHFTDSFTGSLKHEFDLSIPDGISPLAITRIQKKIPADGGMGRHRFGPITLWITDPIGLFRFKVFFDDDLEVEIYPKALALPELPVSGSPFSFQFGNYEAAIKGTSTNFIGVREYEPGDSIRQICWKISSKRPGGVLVKEFEKTVNSEITFLLNLNQSEHSGEKSQSSWEACKDLILGLASQHVSNGNSVQIISTDGQMGFGRGRDHCHLLMKWLYPKVPHPDVSIPSWILRALDWIPARSTVFLVSPALSTESELLFEASRPLLFRDVELTAILAKSASYVRYAGDPGIQGLIRSAEQKSSQTLARLTDLWIGSGASVFHLDSKTPLQRSLLKVKPT